MGKKGILGRPPSNLARYQPKPGTAGTSLHIFVGKDLSIYYKNPATIAVKHIQKAEVSGAS
jgi:hypothetical protein